MARLVYTSLLCLEVRSYHKCMLRVRINDQYSMKYELLCLAEVPVFFVITFLFTNVQTWSVAELLLHFKFTLIACCRVINMPWLLRLCSSPLLDAFCLETWNWRCHSTVLLLVLLLDNRIPSCRVLHSSDEVLSSISSFLISPTVPLSCYLSQCCLTKGKKKGYLRDLSNFPRYISCKSLFKTQDPSGIHLEKASHTQAKGKLLFCLSSLTGNKEYCCFAFCISEANLSAFIAFFQLQMENGDTEKNQARFTNKTTNII